MCALFPLSHSIDVTAAKGGAGRVLAQVLQVRRFTKEICSDEFRTALFRPTSAHTFTLTCIQTMICKLSRFFCRLGTLSRSPLVTYSVSNLTQAKNRSHAEAQLTLYQPVHTQGIKYIKRSRYFQKVVQASNWRGNHRTELTRSTV